MKTFRKIISLFIAFTMIVSMCTSIAFAQDVKFSDVADDHVHYGAIYNLVNRGVLNGYEDGTFKPENTITRAEFAKVIMVSELGDANISSSLVAKFSDTNGHWANRYIAAAVNAGIINGYPEGTFKPDNTVTYAEAVKMVVCALGYGPVIDTTLNPWYSGYIKQASSIGATKNAVAVADNGASRALVAQLISNMADCKRLVQTGTNANGEPIFNTSSGGKDNMFSDDEFSDGYGVLVGVYENSLIGSASTLTKSQIQIDNNVYTLDDGVDYKSLERYIGHSVDYKVRKTSGNRFYVSNIVANNSTKVVTLDADYIDDYSGNTLSYYVDDEFDETDDYKIDDNLYVVYNGYGVPASYINSSFKAEIFDIDAGSVTLYNNDNDSAMDVAIVEKYQTYFTDAVTKKTKEGTVTIKDKLKIQPDITLYEDDVVVTKVTTAGGSETSATYTSISTRQVVSVAEPHSSAPADVPTIVKISTASVSGTVERMQGDYEIVTVKSKDYILAPCFEKFLSTGDNKATYGFEVGSTVKFFLDFDGRIVCTDVTEKTASYAYLIDHLAGSGIDSGVEVRALTTSGKLEEFALASNVSINGGSSVSPSDAIAQLKASSAVINANKAAEYKAPAGSIEQLITYETNSKGEINKIATIGTGTDGQISPYPFKYNGLTAESNFNECVKKTQYYPSTSKFETSNGNKFTIDSSTLIFYVPYGRADADDYKLYKKSSGKLGDDAYHVEPYERDGSSLIADVVVWYGDNGDDTADVTVKSSTVIVEYVDDVYDKDTGKTQGVLSYMKVGSTTIESAIYESSSIVAGIDEGDIIKIAVSSGELDDAKLMYDASADKVYDLGGTEGDDNYVAEKYGNDNTRYFQIQSGLVYDLPDDGADGTISVLLDGTEKTEEYTINGSTKYYSYDGGDSKEPLKSDATIRESIQKYLKYPDSATRVIVVAETYVKAIYIVE